MPDDVPSTSVTGVLELHPTSQGLSFAVGKMKVILVATYLFLEGLLAE